VLTRRVQSELRPTASFSSKTGISTWSQLETDNCSKDADDVIAASIFPLLEKERRKSLFAYSGQLRWFTDLVLDQAHGHRGDLWLSSSGLTWLHSIEVHWSNGLDLNELHACCNAVGVPQQGTIVPRQKHTGTVVGRT
jgi:hypothetical protein